MVSLEQMSDVIRRIVHLDLDAFFASVEELLHPEIKGQPVIVGGGPGRRGVVASASYVARAYGIRSAMPTAQALRLCPNLIIIPGHPEQYAQFSERVMGLLSQYTPVVEQISIDEAFLDLTGGEMLWGPAEAVARTIQQRIQEEIGLPSSLGVATNRLLAKTASELAKPEGLIVVPPGEEAAFLAPLPVERLWGVGPATARRLQALGATTIGELAQLPLQLLERELGAHGPLLYQHARGIDDSPLVAQREPKSMGHEQTFAQDLTTLPQADRALLLLAEKVGRRLRDGGVQGRTVTLKIRRHDFATFTRSATLPHPTDLDQVIHGQAVKLLRKEWRPGLRLRLLGVTVSNFLPSLSAPRQLALLDREARLSRLNHTVDLIRERFGEEALQRASLLGAKAIST